MRRYRDELKILRACPSCRHAIKETIWEVIMKIYFTVQLGYSDSDVTVCLLFWNMPLIQDRDVKFPYKRYTYYLQAY